MPVGTNDMAGLIALIDHPEKGFYFTEVKLIESAKKNVGHTKKYDRVAGTLLSFAKRHFGISENLSHTERNAVLKEFSDEQKKILFGQEFLGFVITLFDVRRNINVSKGTKLWQKYNRDGKPC